ncbi:hypothetical protein HPP92_025502 [Vanilla planifolia]|uniref:Uncharacterized protein n=1 Tax=Vanilla planifolia TaxID=51239 RepID=A0A835PN18_VANPL|nr:hypothetical protein HPP92_025811 [Vanilla planifolia]KAG0454198.1 hypothetical protein HPP92_025502 [Vanilla planifolia]
MGALNDSRLGSLFPSSCRKGAQETAQALGFSLNKMFRNPWRSLEYGFFKIFDVCAK